MALDFLILYEHTVREYESDLLLKLELERRGYTAEIRQLLDPKHLRLFGKDKPEVLVASCMYDNEAINSHVYNNIGRCNKIVNLHWEQMLSDTQEEGDWFNMNGNAKRCVQTCWGKRTAARLGFTFEGVWRHAMIYKGRNRDTAWFAMTDADWARLRPGYEAWIAQADGPDARPLGSFLAQ